MKAIYMRLHFIGILTLFAMIWSSLYHLCKALPGGGNVCLLPFCILKHLDYASSTTVLLRMLLHVMLPVPFYLMEDVEMTVSNNQIWNERVMTWSKYVRREEKTLVLCIYIFIIILLESTLFCSGTHSALLFGLTVGLIMGLVLITYYTFWLLTSPQFTSPITQLWSQARYNKLNLISGLASGIVALILFFIEDVTSISSYWYLHSLWHVFAALSETILLDVRTSRRGIFLFVFCERYSGVEYK
jgi:hypothetical protein